jgi:aminopeptidase
VSGDPRVEAYAKLLVETCIDVQPGWQVIVRAGVLARPLIEAISALLGRKGAYPLTRVSAGGIGTNVEWAAAAPPDVLSKPAPLEAHTWKNADALISIEAPENTRELGSLSEDRLALVQAAWRPIVERLLTNEMKWVGCQFPTPALAQDAGMSLTEFSDFLYGACLLDWDAERERMSRYAELFDAAEEVRIVGVDTDLRLSLAGRETIATPAARTCPVANSTAARSRTPQRARSPSASFRRCTLAGRSRARCSASREDGWSTPPRRPRRSSC